MQPSDDALMARVAAGSEAAFDLLVGRWQREVLRLLWRLTGSREEAEDLAQETFLRVWRSASRYRGDGRFRAWLLRIAANLARSRARRRALVSWLPWRAEADRRPDPAPDPLDDLAARQRRDRVQAALARLPARQREALVLRRFHDLPVREIATVLEISEGAVESLITRALRALRRDLAGNAEDDHETRA